MAAQFIAGNPGVMRGLALWAAYPSSDISGTGVAAMSVYGTLDAGAAKMGSADTRRLLPPDTVFVTIDGGNHQQMGYYTGQADDPPATISRDEQQTRVADATLALLARVQAQPDQLPAPPQPIPAASAPGAPSSAPAGS